MISALWFCYSLGVLWPKYRTASQKESFNQPSLTFERWFQFRNPIVWIKKILSVNVQSPWTSISDHWGPFLRNTSIVANLVSLAFFIFFLDLISRSLHSNPALIIVSFILTVEICWERGHVRTWNWTWEERYKYYCEVSMIRSCIDQFC